MATGDDPDTHAGAPADLAGLLRTARERALVTQEKLAERSGLSVRAIRNLEAGRVGRPRGESVRLLADALGLTKQERAALVAAIRREPGPSAPIVPMQLPADVAEFTGRAECLNELDALLPRDRSAWPATAVVWVIAGSAGVGKTALAVHWAHRVGDRFPDGQLYVNLRGYAAAPPLRPVEALARLLHALGVPAQQVPVEPEEAAGLYRSLLAGRRVVVVLDNANSPEQVRQLLPGSPGGVALVTSRDRLAGLIASHGARRMTLDVLTPGEAVLLLARILGERVAAEPEAVRELARLCAYLPLALRIAAAKLLDQPQQPIVDHVAQLRAGDRLAGLVVDDDPQAAVRVAFDLSYGALPSQAQGLFRLLGLVPGPDVTVEAAAALAGVTCEQAERLLRRLASAHLVDRPDHGGFGFHDLLRLYAADRARREDSDHDRDEALRRLLDWYLHTADAAARLLYPTMVRLPVPAADPQPQPRPGFDDQAGALAWLEAERANLLAAVTHAAQQRPRPLPLAWLLTDVLRGYFWLRRHTVDWLAAARAALAAAEAAGDLRAQAAAQLSLANSYYCQTRHRHAVEHATRAVTLSGQTGRPPPSTTSAMSTGSSGSWSTPPATTPKR